MKPARALAAPGGTNRPHRDGIARQRPRLGHGGPSHLDPPTYQAHRSGRHGRVPNIRDGLTVIVIAFRITIPGCRGSVPVVVPRCPPPPPAAVAVLRPCPQRP